jgi:hypothetical protein
LVEASQNRKLKVLEVRHNVELKVVVVRSVNVQRNDRDTVHNQIQIPVANQVLAKR